MNIRGSQEFCHVRFLFRRWIVGARRVRHDSLIVSDAHLSAEWQLRARHTGALQAGWMSLEPTGRAVAIDGALIGHVSKADADAVRVHVFDDLHLYYDTASLLLQLGF